MFIQRIKTPGIAHVAYVLGSDGEAAVVDPRRDIDDYLRVARENDLSIAYVIETHRQEDFVMGSAELARVTGAKVVNGRHELFGRGDIRLKDGEEFALGKLCLRALHTPGHTPESMCYAVFLDEPRDRAWGVFTGDTLFVGETGRTDLPNPERTSENAGLLFDAVHEKLLPLGDQALLFPAHGSGSVCGGNIAERDDSTLGLERLYNGVFTLSRAEFVRRKVEERIPRPPYFDVMEKLNLRGGAPLAMAPKEAVLLQPKKFASKLAESSVFDLRSPEAFAAGHIPKSYSVWAAGLPVFGGWLADRSSAVLLVLSNMSELEPAVLALARVGIDNVVGVLAGGFDAWRDAGLPIERAGTVTPKTLERSLGKVRVIDVRDDTEFEVDGHIPGASHLYIGYVDEHLDAIAPRLNRSDRVVLACSVGHRASIATSILKRHGYEHVENLLGGMTAWQELALPLERGKENTVTTLDVEGARR